MIIIIRLPSLDVFHRFYPPLSPHHIHLSIYTYLYARTYAVLYVCTCVCTSPYLVSRARLSRNQQQFYRQFGYISNSPNVGPGHILYYTAQPKKIGPKRWTALAYFFRDWWGLGVCLCDLNIYIYVSIIIIIIISS